MNVSNTQRKVLEAMYAGGCLEYGQYGGIVGFLYDRSGSAIMTVHNNTVKALLKRQYIKQDGRKLIIADEGCWAINCVPESEHG